MRWMMQITVTSEDLALAYREHSTGNVANTCPVFQALKRSGVPVWCVFLKRVLGVNSPLPSLPAAAQAVTILHPRDWDEAIVGVTFEYPYEVPYVQNPTIPTP